MKEKMMRILFFTSTDGKLGGAKSLIELVVELKKKGIYCIVLNPYKNELNDELNQIGIENHSVGYELSICRKDCKGLIFIIKYIIKYFRYRLLQLRAIISIERIIDFNTIDIIHTNNTVEDIGVFFSKKYNIPHIWHLREFGKLDFDFVYFRRDIGKYISNNSDRIIAISNAIKTYWVEQGIEENKVSVIIHGIRPECIVKSEHKNDNVLNMILSGAIIPGKGQKEIVYAVMKLPSKYQHQLKIDFYGTCSDKNYLNELLELVSSNGLEKIIEYKGFSQEMNKIYSHYDIGINNSRCEGMGRSTIEYMAAGLYILASNTGANPEILNYGEYGSLFEYGNINSLMECIMKTIKHKNEIKSIGEKNVRVSDKYNIEKNINRIVHEYRMIKLGVE